jgi:hypothetical protein
MDLKHGLSLSLLEHRLRVACHQNAKQMYDMNRTNKLFRSMQMLKEFGMLVTIRISSTRKLKIRLNSGNVHCHSAHNLYFPASYTRCSTVKPTNFTSMFGRLL